jgi:hypothetical protein
MGEFSASSIIIALRHCLSVSCTSAVDDLCKIVERLSKSIVSVEGTFSVKANV